jgi:hypothetical protein
MLPLPITVIEETAEATYDSGILQIAFAVGEPKESAHHIAIKIAKPTDPKPVTPTVIPEKREVAGKTK